MYKGLLHNHTTDTAEGRGENEHSDFKLCLKSNKSCWICTLTLDQNFGFFITFRLDNGHQDKGGGAHISPFRTPALIKSQQNCWPPPPFKNENTLGCAKPTMHGGTWCAKLAISAGHDVPNDRAWPCRANLALKGMAMVNIHGEKQVCQAIFIWRGTDMSSQPYMQDATCQTNHVWKDTTMEGVRA